MADEGQKGIISLFKNMNDLGTSVGFVERGFLKFHKKLTSSPVVKQAFQLANFTKNLQLVHQNTENMTEAEKEAHEEKLKGIPILTTMVALMTSFGGAAKLAQKGTEGTNKALFALGGSILFFIGLALTFAIVVGGMIAVFADLNSPLVNMIRDIPVVGELFNGLRIILTGEDGEGGVKGALGVVGIALIAASAAFLLFGGPVAIFIGTLIAVVGIFRLVKEKTDNFWLALTAGIAGGMAMLTLFMGFVAGFGSSLVTLVMLPITLILGGITLFWLSITGEANYWWGVLGALGVAIGVAVMYANGWVAAMAFLPAIAIGAGIAALILLIVRNWDTVKAFLGKVKDGLVAAWNGLLDFGSIIWDGFMSALNGLIGLVGTFFGFWAGVYGAIWSGITGAWGAVWGFIGGVIDSLMEAVSSIGTKIANKFKAGITWLKGIGGTIKDAAISALNFALSPIVEFWNNNIKGIIPKMTVPDWVPGLGGKSFGPFPGELKYYAEGGLVNSPTLGMIGEAGPEAVIPLRGGNVPVQITGRQSEAEMVKAIKELSQQVAANGNTFNINVDVSGVVAASDRAKAELAKDMAEAIFKQIMVSMPGSTGDNFRRAWYS